MTVMKDDRLSAVSYSPEEELLSINPGCAVAERAGGTDSALSPSYSQDLVTSLPLIKECV